MKRGLVAALLGGLLCCGPAGAETACRVSKAQYDALADGMSYASAVRILGCEGEELSSSSLGGIVTIMLMWDGNSLGGNMNAMFQNGALVMKAQFGLR